MYERLVSDDTPMLDRMVSLLKRPIFSPALSLSVERIDDMKREYIASREQKKAEAIWKVQHPERK